MNRLFNANSLLRSRWMWLLVGGLLITGMVAVAVYQNQPRPVDLTIEDLRSTAIFPDVKVLDILTINLRDPNGGKTFTISRASDGTWTAPNSTDHLDTDAATQIAQTVVLLPFERKLDLDAGADLAQYGFKPAGLLFVEFVLTDQSSHVLAVGGFLPEREQGYYVLVDEQPTIYIVPRGPLDFLMKFLAVPPLTPPATPIPASTATAVEPAVTP